MAVAARTGSRRPAIERASSALQWKMSVQGRAWRRKAHDFPKGLTTSTYGQGPEAPGPAQHLGEVRVEAAEQADPAGVIDARPELFEQRQDRRGGHLDVRAGIGVITAVLAAGDEDEVEGGRGPPGQDRLGTDPRLTETPGQERSEKVAAGREDDAESRLGQAEPDEVGGDVAGVAAERRPHRTEGQLAGPGHPLEPAGDHIDDGDPADEDHRGLLPCLCPRSCRETRTPAGQEMGAVPTPGPRPAGGRFPQAILSEWGPDANTPG